MRKIILILIIGLAFFGCDEKEDETQEEPQDWEATIDLFETYTATVKGISLLPSEWNGVANKVATAIIGAFNNATTTNPQKGAFRTAFMDQDVVIIVSTTVKNCEVKDNDFRTLYLRLNYLDNANIQVTLKNAILAMAEETEGYQLE